MASFLNTDLPSEDEEDDDYAPAPGAEGGGRPAAAKKRRRGQPVTEPAAADEAAEEDHVLPEGPADRAKRSRVDALWQQLQQGPAPSAKPITSLMSLEKKSTQSSSKAKGKNTDILWMRSLGLAPPAAAKVPGSGPKPQAASKPAAAAGAPSPVAGSADKAPAIAPPGPGAPPAAADSSKAAEGGVEAKPSAPSANGSSSSKAALAAAALAAAKELSSKGVAPSYNKVTITETRKFAGKDISVQLQVDKDSKAAKAAAERQKAAASGLDAFLQDIEKKKKVTILDKTKMDWNELKAGDAQLEEEVEAHKRSGRQYLDKQEFLQRTELREYEQERDKRLASDVRLRGRL